MDQLNSRCTRCGGDHDLSECPWPDLRAAKLTPRQTIDRLPTAEIPKAAEDYAPKRKSAPPNQPSSPHLAVEILRSSAQHIENRARQRDTPTGERSMKRTVQAFNAMYGTTLTETQGWQFMVLLKMSRAAAGGYHADDYEDQTAYSALAGECAGNAIP